MKTKAIMITLMLIIPLLWSGCAMYSEQGPAARADLIYEDASVVGRIVALKWPEVAEKSRPVAITMLAIVNQGMMPADLPEASAEMMAWFNMNKAEDVLVWYVAKRLMRYLGAVVLDTGAVDVSGVGPADLQMALRGYLAGLG